MTEIDIQNSILNYLKFRNCLFWRQKNTGVKMGDHWIRSGRKGVSDILVLRKGMFFAIECKTKKGVLSKEQKEFLEQVKEQGGTPIVARSVEDVIKYM